MRNVLTESEVIFLAGKIIRARNYACVVYPESAPGNWQEILSDLKIACLVSPLHDQDINPGGERKKPHFHVMVMYDGPISQDLVRNVFESFGGVGCEKVQSVRGYARYLCHMDNPEKAQYKTEDVTCYGGADFASAIGLPTDKYKAISEMIQYCMDNDIESYAMLLLYASECRYDWFRVLCDNGTMVIKEFLKSRSWDKKQIAGI